MNKSFFYLILSLGALTAFVSCQKQDNMATSLEESQTFKPLVAITPVVDHSDSGLNWDLSDEITYSLSSRLSQRDRLRVTNPQKTKNQLKKAAIAQNPFDTDLTWVKNTFPEEDFVVFMELIEHREALSNQTASSRPESLSAELNLGLRLKVLDLRGNEPQVILQEIIQDSHFIPRQFTSHNFQQSPWNSEDFGLSPIGIAHSLLIKEITTRVEDYVSLSRAQN